MTYIKIFRNVCSENDAETDKKNYNLRQQF